MSAFDKNGRFKVHVDGVGSGITVVNNVTTSINNIEVQNNDATVSPTTTIIDFNNSFQVTSPLLNKVVVSASFGSNIQTISSSNTPGTSLLFTREDHTHKQNLGYIYEAYQTSSQPVSSSPSYNNISFHSTRTDNDIYSINALRNTITFISSGIYEIKYRVSLDDTNNNRAQSLCAMLLNGAQVSGSFSYGIHFNAGQGMTTNIATVTLNISASSTINVVVQKQSGGGNLVTVPNGTNLLITRWV